MAGEIVVMATTLLRCRGHVNHLGSVLGVTTSHSGSIDDVRWLEPTQQDAWRGFLDLHARLAARLNRELQRTSGLSLSDYDVLVHLTDVPGGRLRAFELGEGLQWEKSRVSKQVAR